MATERGQTDAEVPLARESDLIGTTADGGEPGTLWDPSKAFALDFCHPPFIPVSGGFDLVLSGLLRLKTQHCFRRRPCL